MFYSCSASLNGTFLSFTEWKYSYHCTQQGLFHIRIHYYLYNVTCYRSGSIEALFEITIFPYAEDGGDAGGNGGMDSDYTFDTAAFSSFITDAIVDAVANDATFSNLGIDPESVQVAEVVGNYTCRHKHLKCCEFQMIYLGGGESPRTVNILWYETFFLIFAKFYLG